MSGPKKSDVQAQLSVARNAHHRSANLISKTETDALDSLLAQADSACADAGRAAWFARENLDQLGRDMGSLAPDAVAAAAAAGEELSRLTTQAQGSLEGARSASQKAEETSQRADGLFETANRTFEAASAAFRRNNTSHYLHAEMEQAREATRQFDVAQRELTVAAQNRRSATDQTQRVLQTANQALAEARAIEQRIKDIRAEVKARLRAEEEARRIAAENQRKATLAFDAANTIVDRLKNSPAEKFLPGELPKIISVLSRSQNQLRGQELEAAERSATEASAAARKLEAQVQAAQREFDRQLVAAQSELASLETLIQNTDAQLVTDWASDPLALDTARNALRSAKNELEKEAFGAAQEHARAARQQLNLALESAGDNRAQNEVRSQIGESIMDALEELDFDVSVQEGSRTSPLRILGQSANASGSGDFDIAIPLNGEVDFTVEAAQGDASCLAAIEDLRKRLAERGIAWRTTDFGREKGSSVGVGMQKQQEKHTQQEQRKIQGKG